MAAKSAKEMVKQLDDFIPMAKIAILQFEELRRRLETQEDFQKLWESNSAEALKQVGINPDSRMVMGLPPYEEGPRCDWCITPGGKACHC
jgi:hypothetical protein